jgi:zinc protease
MRLLSRFAGQAVELFRDTVLRPALLLAELKRLKTELMTSIEAERADPASMAVKHFNAQLFGAHHPAGSSASVESVRRIRLEDIRSMCDRTFVPGGAALVVAGDFVPERVTAALEPLQEKWTGGEHGTGEAVGGPDAPEGSVIRLVDKPDLTQASVVLGHGMPGEVGDHRHEIALANYILGGGSFSSRLMSEVRSRLGQAYSVASHVARCRRFGTFTVSTSTAIGELRRTIDTVLDVYRRFSGDGVTEEELGKAKQYATGSLAFQFEGIENVAEKLLWLRLYGRQKSYFEDYPDVISAMTKDAVDAAIRHYFSAETLTYAVVGPAREAAGQLRGLGDVVRYGIRSPLH